MTHKLFSRAWQQYRTNGIGSVLHGLSRDVFRFVPIRYRVALRSRLIQARYGRHTIEDPLAVHWIDPDRIRFNGPTYHTLRYVGKALDGDWDLDPTPLSEEWMYEGLRQRFVDGEDWEDTLYYERSKAKFAAGDRWLNYDDFASFEGHRLPYLDQLYEQISDTGYKTKSDIREEDRDPIRHTEIPSVSEITCNVARDGELLLNDGIHRLSIARALDLDRIPIQIVVRHRNWLEILSDVTSSADPAEVTTEKDLDPTHPDIPQIKNS